MKKTYSKTQMKCNDIYTIKKAWWGIGEKSPEKTKNKPRLVSLPSQLYDEESRLFSGLQSRRKTSRAIPIEVGA